MTNFVQLEYLLKILPFLGLDIYFILFSNILLIIKIDINSYVEKFRKCKINIKILKKTKIINDLCL